MITSKTIKEQFCYNKKRLKISLIILTLTLTTFTRNKKYGR